MAAMAAACSTSWGTSYRASPVSRGRAACGSWSKDRFRSRRDCVPGAMRSVDTSPSSAGASFVDHDGVPFFALSDADRSSELRGDANAIALASETKTAVLLPLTGTKVWVIPVGIDDDANGDEQKEPHVRYRPAQALLSSIPPETLDRKRISFLGFRGSDGAALFCADVTGIETAVVNAVAQVEGRSDYAQKEKTWLDQNKIETRDAKSVGPFMKRSDAGVLAQAAGLLTWQRTVRFCAECGSRTALIKAGHKTICRDDTETKCKGVNYPKLMPAVLTLTTCGDFCLLGRNSKWPPGFYSCLAGFVDQSESLEQAVSREVAEESGISVQHERTAFVTSQPWPFPNQLMVGFRAECLEKTILLTSNSRSGDKTSRPSVTKFSYPPSPNLDRNELKDARWFHRDWLREQLGKHGDPRETSKEIPVGSIALPGTHALARRLVEQWVMEDGGGYRGNTSGKKIPVVAFTGGALPVSTLPPTNRSHAFVACEFLGKGGGSVTALRFQPTGGEGAPTKNDHERLAKECEKEASRWVGGLGVGSASGNTLGGGNTTQMDSNHRKAVRFLGGGQICFRGGEVSESAAYDDEREALLVAVVRNGGGGEYGGVAVSPANQEVVTALLHRQYPMHDVLIPGVGQ